MTVRRVSRILLRTIGLLLSAAALLIVVAWNIGWILGDRWIWTQWLSWMPSLVLIPAGILLMAFWPLAFRKSGWQGGLALILAGPMIFLIQNWRPGQLADDVRDGITITHWTMGSVLSDEDSYATALLQTNSELNIIEGGRKIRWTNPVKEWLGPQNTAPSTGIFSVITRLPMSKLRHLVWADGIHVAKLDVFGPGFVDQPLQILLVDLPSDPARSRWDIANQCRDLLDQTDCGEFDLVIGDFNMPSNSQALGALFPGYQPSWKQSGQGWGPTYPRKWPMARLDHVLEGPEVDVTMLRTMDPGLSRHCLQTMTVIPRDGK